MGLSIAAGPRPRSHSRARVEWDSWFYLLSQIRDFPNLDNQVRLLISPRNRVAQLYPRYWVLFSSPSTTCRATVEALEPASTRGWLFSNDTWLSYSLGTDGPEKPLPTAILLLRVCLLRSLPNNGPYLQNHYLATTIVFLSLPSNNSTRHSIFVFIYSNEVNGKQRFDRPSTRKWACYKEVYSSENGISTYMKQYPGQVLLKFSSFGNKRSYVKYMENN
jgi:hypothetical protein